MGAKLDKSETYAEVIGCPGVAFEQNGKHFNFEGQEVGVPELVTDKFTDMSRADLEKFLTDNTVTFSETATDDELREECREVFA